jgi:hypothetical protein
MKKEKPKPIKGELGYDRTIVYDKPRKDGLIVSFSQGRIKGKEKPQPVGVA